MRGWFWQFVDCHLWVKRFEIEIERDRGAVRRGRQVLQAGLTRKAVMIRPLIRRSLLSLFATSPFPCSTSH